jgi:LytS/YehU family sensor histidine kinase
MGLAEELDAIHAYLDIESVRFGARMATEIDCPAELVDALIPSLLLQPVVENAIKFGVAPTRGRVDVLVRARAVGSDIQIIIEDRGGEGPREAPAGEGVGLRNLRDRLDIHYGPAGRFDTRVLANGFRATLRFPLSRAADAPVARRARSCQMRS